MIIFEGAYHLRKHFENDTDSDILWARSEFGFTNDRLTLSYIKHFNEYTKNQTKRFYRMLIFDSYRSHITQQFLDYYWENRIWPYLLPSHTTYLTQPCDVGMFQKFKYEIKKCIWQEVFLGSTSITEADFFTLFNTFYTKIFTPKLCKSAFAKAGLIPFKPEIVLSKIHSYNGIQENAAPLPPCELFSSPGFTTLPPPWNEFNTPITSTQHKRGSDQHGPKYHDSVSIPGIA